MNDSTGTSKMAGRVGSLFALVGTLLFFLGIFGAPRVLAITGLGLMVLAVVGFFIEEQGNRRRMYGPQSH